MIFTGERYIPDTPGHLTTQYEHMHRYALSSLFVGNKDVLDIASGEGYGTALLTHGARSVIGVDIDPESVNHASSEYKNYANLKFLCGSCAAIPLEPNSVDLVTSFETIEHHDQHEKMMLEIKRVLRPNGLVILSSPNRQVYTDELGNVNRYHVKELYHDELQDLLSRHFSCVRIFGQRLASASFVTPLNKGQGKSLRVLSSHRDDLVFDASCLPSPVYYVAICSDDPEQLKPELSSLYVDQTQDLLKTFEASVQHWQRRQGEIESELEKANMTIAAMQGSNFWKLRSLCRKLIGKG